jgi:hypothetical protein
MINRTSRAVPLILLLVLSISFWGINADYTRNIWQPNKNAVYDSILVVYGAPTSVEDSLQIKNFEYFLTHGGVNCSNHDTAIVLTASILELYRSQLQAMDDACQLQGHRAVPVLRNATHCHEMEALRVVLQTTTHPIDASLYRFMIVTSSHVSGPFQPYWTNAFTSNLCCGKILVGLSGNCPVVDGQVQAYVQSMAYAINIQDALKLVKQVLYDCTTTTASEVPYEQAVSSKVLLDGDAIHSVMQGVTLRKYDYRDCTMKDVWTMEGLKEHFGGRMPKMHETLFFPTSWFLPTEIANEIGYIAAAAVEVDRDESTEGDNEL